MTERIENVIDIRSRKPILEITTEDIFREVTEGILEDWYYSESHNNLNEYVKQFLPHNVKIEGADYTNDLNVISLVEHTLGMTVSVFHPGASKLNPNGWLVNFHEGTEIFTTYVMENNDSEHATESYARCLNLVLYLAFQQAKAHYNIS